MKFALAALPLLSVALAQSSASSDVASASGAVSSVAGSVTGSASSTASGAMPSQSGMVSDAYLQQVLGALTAANLTGLVGVATSIATTEEGMALLSQLAQGNKTVFAPNDEAFAAVPEEVSSNTTLLTQILSYHILNNSYTPEGVQVAPAHSIARTLLTGGQYELPGNRSAPLVLTRNSSDAEMFEIIQSTNVTAMGPTAAANLQVYIIDQVLTTPPTLSTLATELAPSLAGVIQMVDLLEPLESTVGLTIFAPNDAAIAAIQDQLSSLNETTVQTILANHVINGTVAYSDRLTTSNYTSAAGSMFSFMTNDTGTYVMSGDSTAMIVATDAIYNKGVIHLIDSVLVNTMSNPEAASSAYESATQAVATMTEPSGPMTQTSDPAASASGSGGSGAPNAGSRATWNFAGLGLGSVIAAAGVVLGGGAILL